MLQESRELQLRLIGPIETDDINLIDHLRSIMDPPSDLPYHLHDQNDDTDVYNSNAEY